jgi:hypothetical protein
MSLYFKRYIFICLVILLACNNEKSITKEALFDELMEFYNVDVSIYDLIITIPSSACAGCVTNVQHRLANVGLNKDVLVLTDINTEINGVDIIFDKDEKLIRTKYWAYYINIVKIEKSKAVSFIEINPNNLLDVMKELEKATTYESK